MWQVKSVDPLGNESPAQSVLFLVDTTPPVIEQLDVPQAVPGDEVTVTFATDDGQGSGVAENECRCWP